MIRRLPILAFVILASLAFAAGERDEAFRIGISMFTTHPAMLAAEQGIRDELDERGVRDVTFVVRENGGTLEGSNRAAAAFRGDVDLVIGLSAPSARSLAEQFSTLPVVFSLVSDPVAAGLVPSLGGGGGNVAGYADIPPVREQIEILVHLGGITSVGHIFSTVELDAAETTMAVESIGTELGIRIETVGVETQEQVPEAAESIVASVDALYVGTDDLILAALPELVAVATQAGIPVVSAEPTGAEGAGVVAAYGYDYYRMGRATGGLVTEILNGANPNELPVRFISEAADFVLVVNPGAAKDLGREIPPSLVNRASKVVGSDEQD